MREKFRGYRSKVCILERFLSIVFGNWWPGVAPEQQKRE